MNQYKHITILGGGPAGLGLGYYAKKNSIPFSIYESRNQTGGNATTIKHGDFLFDSGAHRFHDKFPEITRDIKLLLGEEFTKINVPSQIYHNRKLIDFPLSPINLMKTLDQITIGKILIEYISQRFRKNNNCDNFESFAIQSYTKTLSEKFLLNYSQKLWGLPCERLSYDIAGKRLQGFNLKGFIIEAIYGSRVKKDHLDGSFYYPRRGIGVIMNKMADYCGDNDIHNKSHITRICHDYKRIRAIEINGKLSKKIQSLIVSTLPITTFIDLMTPPPPNDIRTLAKKLHYRDLILVVVFIDKSSITQNASIYFPDKQFPFTRVSEPKNRSHYMSPPSKTSLVAEIPCQKGDRLWIMTDDKLIVEVLHHYQQLGWLHKNEVIDAIVVRLNYAYPILEVGYKEVSVNIIDYFKTFSNLVMFGRNGQFNYMHLHELFKSGKKLIENTIS